MQEIVRAALAFSALLTPLIVAPADTHAKGWKPRGGPAPYGYYRTAGEAVPGWRPEQIGERSTDGKLNWYFLGARPIAEEYWSGDDDASGRVATIAVDPTDANVVYEIGRAHV